MDGLKTGMISSNVIIGGAGFIGGYLSAIVDGVIVDKKDGLEATVDNLMKTSDKPKVVYCLAANLFPEDDEDIKLYRDVYQYCSNTDTHLVYTSSAATYKPDTLYGVQKKYGEVIFQDLPSVSILRLYNVYGKGGRGMVNIIENNDEIMVNGNGQQTRDYIHVNDVAEALKIAGESKWQGVADIGTGVETSVNDLLKLFGKEGIYIDNDHGVDSSVATLNNQFPWKSIRTLEDYAQVA